MQLKQRSNFCCLKVLNEIACKSGINFENFYKKSFANSNYYVFAKEDLDYAIKHSYTTKEFHKILSSVNKISQKHLLNSHNPKVRSTKSYTQNHKKIKHLLDFSRCFFVVFLGEIVTLWSQLGRCLV